MDAAYWFRVVRPTISQEPCMLGFWNFIYGFLMEKSLHTFFFFFVCFFFFCFCFFLFSFFFLVRVISFPGVLPLWKNQNELCCMPYLMNILFEIWYMDSSWKKQLTRIFSCPSYLPFWRYARLKTSEWNLVSKISRKLFKLGAWILVSW